MVKSLPSSGKICFPGESELGGEITLGFGNWSALQRKWKEVEGVPKDLNEFSLSPFFPASDAVSTFFAERIYKKIPGTCRNPLLEKLLPPSAKSKQKQATSCLSQFSRLLLLQAYFFGQNSKLTRKSSLSTKAQWDTFGRVVQYAFKSFRMHGWRAAENCPGKGNLSAARNFLALFLQQSGGGVQCCCTTPRKEAEWAPFQN